MKTLITALLVVFAATVSEAQDFYEKDFAKNPLEEKNQPDKPVAQDNKKESPQKVPPIGPTPDSDIADVQGTEPIVSLGIVVDGMDQEGSKPYLEAILDLLNRFPDIQPGEAIFVGRQLSMPSTETGILLNRVMVMGLKTSIITDRTKLMYRNAPVWLIGLKDKTVALEGLISPEKFIAKDGKFIPPQFMDDQADTK